MEADAVFAEGSALAERAHDRVALARLHGSYAICRAVLGDEDGRERYAREGLRLADEIGDDDRPHLRGVCARRLR